MTKHNAERPTAVYWLWGGPRLLYVGISNHPVQRFIEHRDTKEWWPRVTYYAIKWFETRAEAERAESFAIKNERPQMNIALKMRDEPIVIPSWAVSWLKDAALSALSAVGHFPRGENGEKTAEALRSFFEVLEMEAFVLAEASSPPKRSLDLSGAIAALEAFGPFLPPSGDEGPDTAAG